jgi:L-aspartate oxidase
MIVLWKNCGIVRTRQNLIDTLEEINSYLEEDIGRLLYLRLLTAKSIVESAIERKNSIGAHFIRR